MLAELDAVPSVTVHVCCMRLLVTSHTSAELLQAHFHDFEGHFRVVLPPPCGTIVIRADTTTQDGSMGVVARMLEPEKLAEEAMEERVARLEIHVEHIRTDVADIKVDIRRLDAKIDGVEQRLSAKIDGVEQRLSAKIDGVDQRLSAKIDSLDVKLCGKMDSGDSKLDGKIDGLEQRMLAKFDVVMQALTDLKVGRAFDRVWFLLMSAALLGIMGRAFKWI